MVITLMKKNKKNKVVLTTALIALLVVISAAGIYMFIASRQSPATPSTQLDSEQRSNLEQKKEFLDKQQNNGKQPPQTTTQQPPKQSKAQGTLTAQQTRDSVTITSQLTAASEGTCALHIQNGTQTYTNTAPVLYQDSFSTCEGFTVPISELGGGTWLISIDVSGPTFQKFTLTKQLSVKE